MDITQKLNSMQRVKASKPNILRLIQVEIDGHKIFSLRPNKDQKTYTIFPYHRYFSNTKILDNVTQSELFNLVNNKRLYGKQKSRLHKTADFE